MQTCRVENKVNIILSVGTKMMLNYDVDSSSASSGCCCVSIRAAAACLATLLRLKPQAIISLKQHK